MPEEVNRVLTDHVSTLLFCPTSAAIENLEREGITVGVSHVGDVMYDAALSFGELAARKSNIIKDLNLAARGYYLATVHRAENTDEPSRLRGVFQALSKLATCDCPVILPLHPRTHAALLADNLVREQDARLELANPNVRLMPPVSFLDMVALEQQARVILTDSGGVQKEAYFHGVPCVTLRDETEWTETVEAGWNRICGADEEGILAAVDASGAGEPIQEYGAGAAAQKIVEAIERQLG